MKPIISLCAGFDCTRKEQCLRHTMIEEVKKTVIGLPWMAHHYCRPSKFMPNPEYPFFIQNK